MIEKTIHLTYKMGRRIVIAVVGLTVFALGIVMIVAPGPAFIVIPIGLAILGIEFAWARVWLKKLRRLISENGFTGRRRRAEAAQDRAAQ